MSPKKVHPNHEVVPILRSRPNPDKVSKQKTPFVRKIVVFPTLWMNDQSGFLNRLYKEDVLYQGDTKELPEYQSQPDIPTYVQETTKVPETTPPSRMKAFWDVFLSMTNISVLQDKRMIIICLVICSTEIFILFRELSNDFRQTFVQ